MQSSARQLIRLLCLWLCVACGAAGARAEPVLTLTANLIWERDDPWFGGFSGIEVAKGGGAVTLLTDRRNVILGQMLRHDGQLKGIRIDRRIPIRHANRKLVTSVFADSEGLAVAADGTTYVSFETATRVVRMTLETGATTRLPDHPDFARMKNNKGLEALAIHPNGALYTLAERVPAHRRSYPLYAFENRTWRLAHEIPKRGPFLMVGADFDPRGRLYLLERALSPLGFRSRIRRFDLEQPDLGEITLMTSGAGRFDNMEALAVWTDQQGQINLTLLADDNFRSIQRTQIVEYRLTE